MLVAGEASGDLHGATLARALRGAAPGVRLYGMGGRRMAAEGVQLLIDVTAAATVGGTEAIAGVPGLYRAYRRLRAAAAACRRSGGLPGRPPMAAFTATATEEVRDDIASLLAPELGWSAADCARNAAAYRASVAAEREHTLLQSVP